MNINIAIACDHTGVILKNQILKHLTGQKYNVIDLGTHDKDKAVDYPDFAAKLATYLKNNKKDNTNKNKKCSQLLSMSNEKAKIYVITKI